MTTPKPESKDVKEIRRILNMSVEEYEIDEICNCGEQEITHHHWRKRDDNPHR